MAVIYASCINWNLILQICPLVFGMSTTNIDNLFLFFFSYAVVHAEYFSWQNLCVIHLLLIAMWNHFVVHMVQIFSTVNFKSALSLIEMESAWIPHENCSKGLIYMWICGISSCKWAAEIGGTALDFCCGLSGKSMSKMLNTTSFDSFLAFYLSGLHLH